MGSTAAPGGHGSGKINHTTPTLQRNTSAGIGGVDFIPIAAFDGVTTRTAEAVQARCHTARIPTTTLAGAKPQRFIRLTASLIRRAHPRRDHALLHPITP
jgi:hypothetical protein